MTDTGEQIMDKKLSKAEIQHIAEDLFNSLRKYEDGTNITKSKLMLSAGYDPDEYDTFDLIRIHDALFDNAEANDIVLDMSAHNKKYEGLPFALDYAVKRS